ncbi:MAG: hypothetical protein OEV79_10615 [candidate division WOR-3 bacterium]|nr:hypothetical protein [candidate division WOR-3 bacterium]
MHIPEVIVISKNKYEKLGVLLEEFCSQANTIWALFSTLAGQLVVQRGFVDSFDVLTINAVACSIFNSTMELAHIVGDKKFSSFLQEGASASMYYTCIDDDYLLVTLFDNRTLPGLVRVAAADFCAEAVRILETEG